MFLNFYVFALQHILAVKIKNIYEHGVEMRSEILSR